MDLEGFVRHSMSDPVAPTATAPCSPLPFQPSRPLVTPIMPVVDLGAAAGFYESIGFVVENFDDGYAWVRHCGWEVLHLRVVDSVVGNEASAYLHVDDAAAWRAAMMRSCGEVELARWPTCRGACASSP